jgi:hypothetical protein
MMKQPIAQKWDAVVLQFQGASATTLANNGCVIVVRPLFKKNWFPTTPERSFFGSSVLRPRVADSRCDARFFHDSIRGVHFFFTAFAHATYSFQIMTLLVNRR